MFIQTGNPFGEMLAAAYSPITEFSYSNKTSNIWRIILGMIFLIGGVFVYFVLKQKNEEVEAEKNEIQNLDNGLNKNV